MPCGKKRKRHKISTHKRKKRLRKNRHKKKQCIDYNFHWKCNQVAQKQAFYHPIKSLILALNLLYILKGLQLCHTFFSNKLVSNELIINSTPAGDRIALLHDKRIVEYHIEQSEPKFSVGDIYLGTVKKLVSGLNAAFIDIGYEKDAFLHYHDLGPNLNTVQKFTRDVLTKKRQKCPNRKL